MNDTITQLAEKLSEMNISYKANEPLCNHSTFKIGGPAALFVSPSAEKELAATVTAVGELGVKYYVAGKGSNIVYPDAGYDGAIISTLSIDHVSVDGCMISAGAGVSFTELAVIAAKHGLTGLEFAYGIPGSLGGAVFMNAGAYDGEIKDVVHRVHYYDISSCSLCTCTCEESKFGYRDSLYKHHGEYIILGAELLLKEGSRTEIESKMSEFMSRRKDKQPLEYPSAGSAFKRYPGRYTAQMIDEAGLKGYSVGGAQISEKHAGFIINKGGATASDIKELSDTVKTKLKELYGIEIESEIIFVE